MGEMQAKLRIGSKSKSGRHKVIKMSWYHESEKKKKKTSPHQSGLKSMEARYSGTGRI